MPQTNTRFETTNIFKAAGNLVLEPQSYQRTNYCRRRDSERSADSGAEEVIVRGEEEQ